VVAVSLSAFAGFARAADAEPKAPEKEAAPADAAQDAPALAGPKEKLSYALGMSLGRQFRSQSIEVDPDVYVRGLRDALSGGKTLLTETEARSAVNALQGELKKKQAAPTAPGALTGIAISFKMDPRITRGMYMGDRWISPPTFTSTFQEGKETIVEARVHGVDARMNKKEDQTRMDAVGSRNGDGDAPRRERRQDHGEARREEHPESGGAGRFEGVDHQGYGGRRRHPRRDHAITEPEIVGGTPAGKMGAGAFPPLPRGRSRREPADAAIIPLPRAG
jgi:hypothetical protein